jgi:predicted alpha/beta hydrolase
MDEPMPGDVDVTAVDLHIPAHDGLALAATVFEPVLASGSTRPVTVISSAAAVPRAYYTPFARYLAATGRTVLTYDYRGIGGSLVGPIAQCKVRMRDWGQLDARGVTDFAAATYPGRPLHWIGHSYGGGFAVGLNASNPLISRHLGVAVPHGYWREMAWPENYKIGLLMGLGVPALTAIAGYLPGKLAGIGEDLPTPAALEWRSWIMHRNSMWDTLPADALQPYAQCRAAMAFFCIADDPWATATSANRMSAAFPSAAMRDVTHMGPVDAGGHAIGHLGFFRRKFATTLWPRAIAWLDG